ncbi:MAG: tRNA (adenosine(37)-N6)-threonylcarbamoyltransferase complex transferase subunit TsaD [bacterium]|nr:tRNA (adenosine(37)-N6)-threonylcarbamoyltransferase complex transferase subunit TsaD [bacterium]
MKILGIESSCDETAASVVEDGSRLLSNVVRSQIDIHSHYGGVVPEVAARNHIEVINPVINTALADADCTWDDIDAIAVTYAPGLIGSLLVGTLAARTLARLKHKPLYPIHHVEAHVYANFITSQKTTDRLETDLTHTGDQVSSTKLSLPDKQPEFPMLALIVSGGHTQLVLFQGHGDYRLLGETQDDAVGEAFDKVAKILGLPYPGGPSITAAAQLGDCNKYRLPKANFKCTHSGAHTGMERQATGSDGLSRTDSYDEAVTDPVTPRSAQEVCHYYDFSFSGLKTAVLRAVQHEVGVDFTFPSTGLAERLNDQQRQDFAASFQKTAIDTLVDKAQKAYQNYSPKSVVIAGGVAANQMLRDQLTSRVSSSIEYAPMQLCTDNGAMIATLAYYYSQVQPPVDPAELEVTPSLSMTKTAWAK